MAYTPYHILFIIVLLSYSSVRAENTTVAVASNFSTPMKAIIDVFQYKTGHSVDVIIGSSGKIYSQIINGAPFDVFLSADSHKPEKLESAGFTVSGSRFIYASGRLMLWSASENHVRNNDDLLKSARFKKIAIANPRHAPYGVAAKQVLTKYGLWPSIERSTVMGENISQTYQFVFSGNVELGFVALSQVSLNGQLKSGSGWIIPSDFHQPIHQQAVLLRRAKGNAAAKQLLGFLKSDSARKIMQSYGYRMPEH